jgi:hypothetical protein
VAYLFLVRAYSAYDQRMAHFHSGGSDHLWGVVKLAARLLRYSVSWKSSFLFAVIVLVIVISDHVLAFRQPVTIRIGHAVVLLVGLLILGSWFFSERGTNRNGTVLGWGGGIRLIALAFAMMVVVAFTIVLLAQVFLSKNLSSPP